MHIPEPPTWLVFVFHLKMRPHVLLIPDAITQIPRVASSAAIWSPPWRPPVGNALTSHAACKLWRSSSQLQGLVCELTFSMLKVVPEVYKFKLTYVDEFQLLHWLQISLANLVPPIELRPTWEDPECEGEFSEKQFNSFPFITLELHSFQHGTFHHPVLPTSQDPTLHRKTLSKDWCDDNRILHCCTRRNRRRRTFPLFVSRTSSSPDLRASKQYSSHVLFMVYTSMRSCKLSCKVFKES